MEPRFTSLSHYEDEIERQQQELKDIHKRQYESMLKNDSATVDALELKYKAKENELSDIKNEMYEVMGAFVRGKRGNQLLEDERGDASKASNNRDKVLI